MTKKRPTGITVFAILNLVFGGLGMLCSLCGAAGQVLNPMIQNMQAQQAAKGGPDMPKITKDLEAKIPGYMAGQWIQIGVGLTLNVILILAGISLLRMSPAGRWASIAYALARTLLSIGVLIYSIGFVAPAVNEWFEQQRDLPKEMQLPKDFFVWTIIGGTVVSVSIPMAYAVALLIFMLLPGTAKALRADHVEGFAGGEEEFYDADYDRKRRELPPEN